MRVTYPPVEDYKPLGRYISNHCADYPTYILEEVKTYELKKRSVDAQLAGDDETVEFVEFAGNKIVQFLIVDHGLPSSQ
ncbi:hypothetical protein SK128_028589 [Halocaridina rubra]|uniref:BRICHOS domain-containing protein n=1 Tax=Halocaridina rubra TaxID=373956 RepID=A0AAN8XFV1_HALRR